MGSVKFKDLKAFVRYDGSGRVVAGSLVFRKKKPKNGRWGEISSNLCCNPGGNSTTTTTTQGGVTPTAFVTQYWVSVNDSCNTTTQGDLLFYSASATLDAGVAIFQDAALTIPVTQGYVINPNPMLMAPPLAVGAGGVLSVRECTTTTTTTQNLTFYNIGYQAYGPAQPCANQGFMNAPLTFDPNTVCFGGAITLASGTWSNYGISEDQYYYVNVNNGNVVGIYIAPGGQVANTGCTSCG